MELAESPLPAPPKHCASAHRPRFAAFGKRTGRCLRRERSNGFDERAPFRYEGIVNTYVQ